MSWLYLVLSLVLIVVACAGIACAALVWGRRQLQKAQRLTYEVTDPEGVEILEPIDIDGRDHWVHVRGRNRNNPILLFLHGGPGFSHIGWYDAIQRPWEDYFTVVQWDQLQAGKSYVSAKEVNDTMNHQSMIEDTEKMIAKLRMRFNQDKIFIMGTSYGTYLGMQMVKRHPEWLHAYVGVGQVVNMMEHARVEYELLLDCAKTNGDKRLVTKLESLAPMPGTDSPAKTYMENVFFFMEEESRYGKAFPKGVRAVVAMSTLNKCISPLYSLVDLMHHFFGDAHAVTNSKNTFYSDYMDYDLPTEIGSQFEAPVIFFTGAHDFHVAYSLSDNWYKQIEAPYKEQVWFKHSAHAAYIEEPHEFTKALVERVLPLADGNGC